MRSPRASWSDVVRQIAVLLKPGGPAGASPCSVSSARSGRPRASQEVEEEEGEDRVAADDQGELPADLAHEPGPGDGRHGQELADRPQLDEGPESVRVPGDAEVGVPEGADEKRGHVEE